MRYFLNRLREPSTWAGLSVIGGLFGLNPAIFTTLGGVATAVGAAVAVLLPEHKGG